MRNVSGRSGRGDAKIVSRPSIGDPLSEISPSLIAQVKTSHPDGFGCDVQIIAECDAGFGGEHEPHIAIRMAFFQQHAIEVRGSSAAHGRLIEQPTATLHAWGGEALALPDALRKAADAAEAALKAHNMQREGWAA
jgi:hypothetical protein